MDNDIIGVSTYWCSNKNCALSYSQLKNNKTGQQLGKGLNQKVGGGEINWAVFLGSKISGF